MQEQFKDVTTGAGAIMRVRSTGPLSFRVDLLNRYSPSCKAIPTKLEVLEACGLTEGSLDRFRALDQSQCLTFILSGVN